MRSLVCLVAVVPAVAHADPLGPYELRVSAVATATAVVSRSDLPIELGPGLVIDVGGFVRSDSDVVAHIAFTTFDEAHGRAELLQSHVMGEVHFGRVAAGIGLGVELFRASDPSTSWSVLFGANLEGSVELARRCHHAVALVFDVSAFPFNPLYHAVVSGKIPDQLLGLTASAGLAYRY